MERHHEKEIKRLAGQGASIPKIMEIMKDNFPEYDYDYDDIFWVIRGSGDRTARGAKATITRRLEEIVNATRKQDRREIIKEISDLVWNLYDRVKSNQSKLEEIRKILKK